MPGPEGEGCLLLGWVPGLWGGEVCSGGCLVPGVVSQHALRQNPPLDISHGEIKQTTSFSKTFYSEPSCSFEGDVTTEQLAMRINISCLIEFMTCHYL